MRTVLATVFAAEDLSSMRTLYGVYTLAGPAKESIMPDRHFQKHAEPGIWDGVEASGIYGADNLYSSLEELVENIRAASKEHGLLDITFLYDFPDYIDLSFHEREDGAWTALENSLARERPLNENERHQFFMAFAALSVKK